jgi:hypothetical protein
MEGIPLVPKGRVRGYQIHCKGQRFPVTLWQKNLTLYDWAGIVTRLLSAGDRRYRISTMYMEFANVAMPGDTVTVPTFSRGPGAGVSYYNGLSSSPNADFLRVPIISGLIDTTNPTNFPLGNMITFFAQSQGTTGTYGKAFSAEANSVVYGGALVATPDNDDPTQDIVLARFYYPTDQQIPKLDSGQVGIEWNWTAE